MALLFVFYFNPATRDALEKAELFPDDLKKVMMVDHRK